MRTQKFNLTTDPWIKVIEAKTNHERTVSLIELFQNASNYRQLAGEMRSQDLAILRLLLAILTTVYSRFDANGEAYDWLSIDDDTLKVVEIDDDSDEIEGDLRQTWKQVYQTGHFSEIVTHYLERYASRFDLFGDHPFYQATRSDYDELVPADKCVENGKGRVAVQQINRRISESGNSKSIFTPKSGAAKNQIELDELVRWIITYQNFTGVTDKTKITSKQPFSNSAGWLYRLNPVYADGQSIFEVLVLNLILSNESNEDYVVQKPVWEYETIQDYVMKRNGQSVPDNLAELYTTWSRVLHIEWDEENQPTIFSAGVPIFEADNAFIEPMTLWRQDKKTSQFRPAVVGLQFVGKAMWRSFGQYVNVNQSKDVREPGIVSWLNYLRKFDMVEDDRLLKLVSTTLISDGNMSSQMPATEMYDDLKVQADVLFDVNTADYWPARIEDAIDVTQKVGNDYYHFIADIGRIRNINVKAFAADQSGRFYERLNQPFKDWLASLTGQDDREAKINAWKQTLRQIVLQAAADVMQSSSPRDISGIIEQDKNGNRKQVNIFTVNNNLHYRVMVDLK